MGLSKGAFRVKDRVYVSLRQMPDRIEKVAVVLRAWADEMYVLNAAGEWVKVEPYSLLSEDQKMNVEIA